jgi:phosphoserine phosphatase
MDDYLVLTVSGLDQSGTTAGVTRILSNYPLVITQLQQIVLQGELVLGLTLKRTSTVDNEQVQRDVESFVNPRGMTVRITTTNEGQSTPGFQLLVTVLGNPLTPTAVAAITGTIASHNANIDRIRQVAEYPVTAIEFEISGASQENLRSALADVARANSIDIAVQRASLDRRGVHLVVLDVDSTLIKQEVIDILARFAGVEKQVSEITHRAMNGELDFSESLNQRVTLLAGLPASVLNQVRSEIEFTPGAATLCRTLHRLGFHVALVSGGFSEIVTPLAAELGVVNIRANQLEVVDGLLTGRLIGEIVDRSGKASALKEFAKELGVPMSRTIAVGDGANDLDMLNAAALGIAFNAKPFVRDRADSALTSPYLDAILYLMGINRAEIEQADSKDSAR